MSSEWVDLIPPEIWERAILEEGYSDVPTTSGDFEAIVVAAFSQAGADLAKRQADEDKETVLEVLSSLEIATVALSFPSSMHGDAIWVSVSRFPGGTAVGVRSDSSYGGHKIVFVLSRATANSIESAARDAIYDAQDGADWNVYEDDEDPTEDGIPATFVGFDKLRQTWNSLAKTSVLKKRPQGRKRRHKPPKRSIARLASRAANKRRRAKRRVKNR